MEEAFAEAGVPTLRIAGEADADEVELSWRPPPPVR